ncbi:MAG: hypothetical protein J6Y24_13495 [Bacteroidales bacterium]|nr:hypothetical protein [Bacteroidales bacterium]
MATTVKLEEGITVKISDNIISDNAIPEGTSLGYEQNGRYDHKHYLGTGIFRPKNNDVIRFIVYLVLTIIVVPPYIYSFYYFQDTPLVISILLILCFIPLILIIGMFGIGKHLYLNRKIAPELISETINKVNNVILNNPSQSIKNIILNSYVGCLNIVNSINQFEQIIKITDDTIKTVYKEKLKNANAELKKCRFDTIKNLSETQLNNYKNLCKSFDEMASSKRITYLNEQSDRISTEFYSGCFQYIYSFAYVPIFQTPHGKIYIYPDFIIKTKDDIDFEIIELNKDVIQFNIYKLNEKDIKTDDTEKYYTTYLNTTKLGLRDLRYSKKNNPQIDVFAYGVLQIPILNATFYISSKSKTEKFFKEFAQYVTERDNEKNE